MKILYSKSSLAFLIYSLVIIAFFIPNLSFAYGGKHHGYYGYRHYGYSKHYGYRKYRGYKYYPRRYYRRRHYSYYPSRSHYKYPKTYSFTVPVKTKVYSENNANQHSNVEYSGLNSSAWQTLAEGQYRAALNSFAVEAQSHPSSGVPKAGYALAMASNGNFERGVWAMRRAFRINPDSLHYLQLDEKGHALIDKLIAQYSSLENDTDVDQAFMVSALHYLKHDYAAAKKSITNALQHRDKSSSFSNLQKLIDQQLTESKFM